MTRKLIALTLAAALALPAGAHASSDDGGPVDAATAEQIRTMLTAEGYDVRRIKRDDGHYEAYAVRNGQRMEILVNAQMQILRTEIDD